jgi:ABC-type Na+ transport system ATPase subunit NatA/ABC-type multidrug transport system permease subunit
MPVIEVENLSKRYGNKVAVDGISFDVEAGEIFGILGRNGAGKTTTVEMIEGLREPDGGTVRVLGLDPRRDRAELRRRVGVQLQESRLQDRITVEEALALHASFHRAPADPDQLMDELGLADARATRFAKLSGGQQQRLSIALALIGDPEIAVLDELTTGLDPQARRDTWGLIERIRDRGVTVVLVTHFMEEAERLADRVALLDRGTAGGARHARRDGCGKRRRAAHLLPRRPAARRRRPPRAPARGGRRARTARHRLLRAAARRRGPRRRLPRPHGSMIGLTQLTRTEARLYMRDAVTLGFVFLLPLALLLAFGIPPDSRRPSEDLGGQIPIDTVLPSMALTLAFGMLGVFALPAYLVDYRVRGVLRRLATTPASPAMLLAAQLVLNLALAAASVALVLAVGAAALGMALPENVPGLVLVLVLGATALLSLGLVIAALAPDTTKAWALGALFFFPSLFLAGLYLPKEQMGSTLSRIGDFTPLGAFRESLEGTWTGSAPEPLALAVMAITTVAAGAAAAKTFRWE